MTLLNLANLLRLEPTWPRRYIHAMWETTCRPSILHSSAPSSRQPRIYTAKDILSRASQS